MGFEPKEIGLGELKASSGFTVKATVLDAFCNELSVTITFAYNSPKAFAVHVNDAIVEFEIIIVFVTTPMLFDIIKL